MPDLAEKILARIEPTSTAEEMATVAHEVICQAAIDDDQDAEDEVVFRQPGDPRSHGKDGCYWLAWEAGPSNWAWAVGIDLTKATGKTVWARHSFSLEFDPRLDRGQGRPL